MNVPWFIFITLLAMCVVVGIAFMTPQVPYEDVVLEDGSAQRVIKSHGYDHDTYSTMFQGGPGAERHAVTIWIGWVFAMLSILFFVACNLLGVARDGKLGPAKVPFIIGTVLYAAIFTAVIVSYNAYMHEDTHTLSLSLPKPTAWMIFGIWPIPLFFIVVYSLYFDRWHFTAKDEERFEEILARSRQTTPQDS
jgi:hypothetical protein